MPRFISYKRLLKLQIGLTVQTLSFNKCTIFNIACFDDENITRNKFLFVYLYDISNHKGLPSARYKLIVNQNVNSFLILPLVFKVTIKLFIGILY
jgi:poly(3-hydroxyalkanoate) synthetase